MHNKLKEQLKQFNGKAIDICAQIYKEFFLDAKCGDEAATLLQVLCESWGTNESDNSLTVQEQFSEEEYDSSLKKAKPLVDTMLDNLVMEVLPEEEFYEKLWHNMNNDILFSQPIDKICALYTVLHSVKVPYYSLPFVKEMSDADFAKYCKEVYPIFRKAYFIINRGYTQFTQIATQILEVLDEIEDQEQKAVLLSMILATFLRQSKKVKDTSENIEG